MDNKQSDTQPSGSLEEAPQGIATETGETDPLMGNGDRNPLMGNGDRGPAGALGNGDR